MRVLIVDDDDLVVLSLKTILEAEKVEVVGTGTNGTEAIQKYRELKPDVLLMDIRMQGMDGLKAAECILEEFSNASILFLTTFSDDEYIVQALCLGAKGYILKQDYENLLAALRAVCSGQSVFGREIVSKMPALLQKNKKTEREESERKETENAQTAKSEEKEFEMFAGFGLTQKDLLVMKQVAAGKNNREIAETLYLGEGTVRNYISEILEKLQLRDRTQLAIFYLTGERRGIETVKIS